MKEKQEDELAALEFMVEDKKKVFISRLFEVLDEHPKKYWNDRGINNTMMEKWKIGKYMPTSRKVMIVACCANISYDWLFGFSENKYIPEDSPSSIDKSLEKQWVFQEKNEELEKTVRNLRTNTEMAKAIMWFRDIFQTDGRAGATEESEVEGEVVFNSCVLPMLSIVDMAIKFMYKQVEQLVKSPGGNAFVGEFERFVKKNMEKNKFEVMSKISEFSNFETIKKEDA